MALMSPYSDGINELKLFNLVLVGRKKFGVVQGHSATINKVCTMHI